MLRVKCAEMTVDRITKAVVTAAGVGSRLLPFTKSVPKAMLPCCTWAGDGRFILKPALQMIYESLYRHGCRKFCFVVGRGRQSIEEHFMADGPDTVACSTNNDLCDFSEKIRSSSITYAKQLSPRGFGDAALMAKTFAGNDTILLHASDDMVLSQNDGHIQRLEDAFFSTSADVAFLVQRVKNPERYGVIDGKSLGRGLLKVEHLEEKPRRPRTNLTIVPVYAFRPSIFSALEKIAPDANGEIQLSDAMASIIAAHGKCVAVELADGEKRLDLGTPEGYAACIMDLLDIHRSNDDARA